ncbi:patatin-like phospholipase family protein [Aequorivita sinensis]|uniref:patatin-like phospholipase family protein n=1 Tax=Aequorivita sinensis TaxID=1382458 RepID=UPI002300790C|nr:patatin-like phospholipase family protein [Aequorivita sinensis]
MGELEKNEEDKPFRILVLDGGGSKGIYTLGILNELELKLGSTLDNHFDLIYGTSTGSIIGALIGLGKSIKEIKQLYIEYIPEIMSKNSKKGKSSSLKELGDKVFGKAKFDDLKTDIGIVALNFDTQNPLVFKSNIKQAHGMHQSFVPGFGCTISEAVQCSCSAYPIFDFKFINTSNQGRIKAIDGGFIANNATLFALVDADKAFKIKNENIRVVSVGTGKFIEKPVKGFFSILKYLKIVKFIERVLLSSTNTNVILTKLIYPHVQLVRLNDTYNEPEYGTNMVEQNLDKLEKLFQLGRDCYAKNEKEINNILAE